MRLGHFHSRVSQSSQESRIITAAESRVRLLRRTKLILHSKMELHAAALELAPTAFGNLPRLGQFRHSQKVGIEGAGLLFFVWRHRRVERGRLQ